MTAHATSSSPFSLLTVAQLEWRLRRIRDSDTVKALQRELRKRRREALARGLARADALDPVTRSAIASQAAQVRWAEHEVQRQKCQGCGRRMRLVVKHFCRTCYKHSKPPRHPPQKMTPKKLAWM